MKRVFLKLTTWAAIICALSTASLQAENIPDAGSILREQEFRQQLPQPFPIIEKEQIKHPLLDSGIHVTARHFAFSGYEGVATEEELQAIVADAIGKNLSYSELQALADKVTTLFKQKGWFLARAYLPEQDVTSGTITITITQGKSDGQLSITTDKTVRINQSILHKISRNAVRPGQPINERRLERSILLINDLPGVIARSSVSPGSLPGSSKIGITISEGPLLKGSVWADNYSNRYTGTWRGNAILLANDPFRKGDQISLMAIGAEGLTQGGIGYSLPITADGLKGNFSYTGMLYKLVDELEPLHYKGHSNSIDANLSYPLRRSRSTNIMGAVSYSYQSLIDSHASVDIRDRKLNSFTFNGNGDLHDNLLGGGYTSWNIGITTGNFHESIADISDTKTEGRYTRFNFGLTRLQHLAERISLNFSWNAQTSLNNLDSREKFFLGGQNGIRSYPVGEGAGDQGHLINTDIRYSLPFPASWGSVQLSGFYDAGHITLNKEQTVLPSSTATNRNDYWLQGAGLGLNYISPGKFALRGSWAHVIGDNPGRSATGKNSDGRSDTYRFWLQSMMYF